MSARTLASVLICLFAGCAVPDSAEPAFESLFDGRTLAGWRGYRQAEPPPGWAVVDGAITRVGPGGDLLSERTYGDFELEFEWRIAPGGNSGVFYGVTEEAANVWESGAEMQILDDAAHGDGLDPHTSAGANYALHAPSAAKRLVAPGSWNTARIIVRDDRVRHFLNGAEIVSFERYSPDWEARVAASKFAAMPAYGRARVGHIALQDHGDTVAYRALRIRRW